MFLYKYRDVASGNFEKKEREEEKGSKYYSGGNTDATLFFANNSVITMPSTMKLYHSSEHMKP